MPSSGHPPEPAVAAVTATAAATAAASGNATAIVVMGVCGSGKSAVARALGQQLGLAWLDADDLHAPEAVARMRAGMALRDEDRWPWLDRVGARLAQAMAAAPCETARAGDGAAAADPSHAGHTGHTGQAGRAGTAATSGALAPGLIVACSALRRVYRDRLRAACPGLRFVFLDGAEALLAQRLAGRLGHYMAASLLPSQLQTLERPGAEEPDAITLDIAPPLAQVVQAALHALAAHPGARP